jgi:hypothetical protein
VAVAFEQALGEANGGFGFGIYRPALPRPRDVGVAEAGVLAQEGVGRQAIVAAIALGDRKRDLLAHLGSERAVRNCAVQAEQAFERGRRLGGNAKHVGGDAETFLHGVEQVFGLALHDSRVESGNTGHGDLLAVCAIADRRRLVTVRNMRYVDRRFNWPELTDLCFA